MTSLETLQRLQAAGRRCNVINSFGVVHLIDISDLKANICARDYLLWELLVHFFVHAISIKCNSSCHEMQIDNIEREREKTLISEAFWK